MAPADAKQWALLVARSVLAEAQPTRSAWNSELPPEGEAVLQPRLASFQPVLFLSALAIVLLAAEP